MGGCPSATPECVGALLQTMPLAFDMTIVKEIARGLVLDGSQGLGRLTVEDYLIVACITPDQGDG